MKNIILILFASILLTNCTALNNLDRNLSNLSTQDSLNLLQHGACTLGGQGLAKCTNDFANKYQNY